MPRILLMGRLTVKGMASCKTDFDKESKRVKRWNWFRARLYQFSPYQPELDQKFFWLSGIAMNAQIQPLLYAWPHGRMEGSVSIILVFPVKYTATNHVTFAYNTNRDLMVG